MTASSSGEGARLLPHLVYAEEMRVHAVTWIWLGHQHLDTASLTQADEDDITGELVRSMKEVQFDSRAPEWILLYEVHEQNPQNNDGKRGKHRPKMDIDLERRGCGKRVCLGFEAKRLRNVGGLRDYLGVEGMGAFLSGHYSTTHGEAGMLGYVQHRSATDWASDIANRFQKSPGRYGVSGGSGFDEHRENPEAPWFSSRHEDFTSHPLRVVHVLLPCH